MEDVLDLYDETYDPKKPVVCFDEMPYQMVASLYKAFEPEEARDASCTGWSSTTPRSTPPG
jgi:hypothetical protein